MIPAWLLPLEKARPIYAAILEQIRKLEAAAKRAGINTRLKK